MTLIKLFLPHRKLSETKSTSYETYKDFLDGGSRRVSVKDGAKPVSDIVRANECQFNYGDSQIDDGITILQSCGELEGAWACIALNTESD